MSQLEDIKALIKNDRRILAGGAFVVIALFIWMITNSGGSKRRPAPRVPVTASDPGMGEEGYAGDLIIAFKNDINQGKEERRELISIVERQGKELDDFKSRTGGIFETLVDKFEALTREVDELGKTVSDGAQVAPTGRPPLEGPDGLDVWLPQEKPEVIPPPPEPRPLRVSVIAPADYASAELVTGVNAPVDGTPYPAVFRLTGPIEGPDGATLDLGEARIIAAAQGSESDSRALFRLSQLAIRHPNGRRAVVEINGWVVGEDGLLGMEGRLIDKLGRLIVATAAISAAGALATNLEDKADVTVVNGAGLGLESSDIEYAAASAITDATNRLGQVLLNRYESLVPVVEVLSGREVAVIFSQPAEIAILEDELG